MHNSEYNEAIERLSKLPSLKLNLKKEELTTNHIFEKKENEKEYNSILEITKNLMDYETCIKYESPSNLKYIHSILQNCFNKLIKIEYFDKTKDETIGETIKETTISFEDYSKFLIEKHENKLIENIESNQLERMNTSNNITRANHITLPKLKKEIKKKIIKNRPDEEYFIDILNLISKDLKYKKSIQNLKDYLNLNSILFDTNFINFYFKFNFNKSLKKEENYSILLKKEFRIESIQLDFTTGNGNGTGCGCLDHSIFNTFGKLFFSNFSSFEFIKLHNIFYFIFILNSKLFDLFISSSKNQKEEKHYLKLILEYINQWIQEEKGSKDKFYFWFENQSSVTENLKVYFQNSFLIALKNLLKFFYFNKSLWSVSNGILNSFNISNEHLSDKEIKSYLNNFNFSNSEIYLKLFICLSRSKSVKSIEGIKSLF
eukprot:gene8143-12604_t